MPCQSPSAFHPANATEGEGKIAQAASFGNASRTNREEAEKVAAGA
jgi:hypothetical protein